MAARSDLLGIVPRCARAAESVPCVRSRRHVCLAWWLPSKRFAAGAGADDNDVEMFFVRSGAWLSCSVGSRQLAVQAFEIGNFEIKISLRVFRIHSVSAVHPDLVRGLGNRERYPSGDGCRLSQNRVTESAAGLCDRFFIVQSRIFERAKRIGAKTSAHL